MSCTSCKSKPATTHPFDAVFNRFWPPSAPFPPMAPYLAAAVSRTDARRWASAIGADQDPAMLGGSAMAVLDMLGRAMMDPSGRFAGVRSEAKKGKTKGETSGRGPAGHDCGISCPDGSSAGVNCPDVPCYQCQTGCNPSAYADCVDICGGGDLGASGQILTTTGAV